MEKSCDEGAAKPPEAEREIVINVDE